MWSETADIHAQGYVARLMERVKTPDFSTFDDVEKHFFALITCRTKR